jgi:hypothetical protein
VVGPSPQLTPALLATCKHIHSEAKDIIYDNEFLVTALTSNPGVASSVMFHRKQLPETLASRITNMTLLIAGHLYNLQNYKVKPPDTKTLQYATSLQNLRIMAIALYDWQQTLPNIEFINIMDEILRRVPATCTVTFGADTVAQMGYLQRRHAKRLVGDDEAIIDASALESIAADVKEKGCKFGSTSDYRFPVGSTMRGPVRLGAFSGGLVGKLGGTPFSK